MSRLVRDFPSDVMLSIELYLAQENLLRGGEFYAENVTQYGI